MSRDFLIHNGKLTSDLDADGNQIKNLPGVAHLVDGKVPSDELPSYVDDVLEYATRTSFPATGERGKIYVALDTNKTYRWSGTTYVEVGGGSGPSPSTSAPAMDGTATPGESAAYARGDHVHPTDTSRASTADATLAERGPNHDGLSAWTIKRAGIDVTEQVRQPESLGEISEGVYVWRVYLIEGDDGQTQVTSLTDWGDTVSLSWSSSGGMYTATRTALSGYQLGPDDGLNPNKPLASEAEAEALRTGKQDALSAQQLANIAAVPNKADAADLRYSLNTATVTPGSSVWTANYSQIYDKHGELVDVNLPEWGTYSTPDGDKTGWFWYNPEMVYNLLSEDESATLLTVEWDGYDGEEYVSYTINFSKTTSPATVTNVKDRAINAVALSGNATLTPPSQVSGKSRDFFLSVANSGSSNATVTVSGAVLIDPAMNAVTLVAKPSAITTWRLTEMVNSSGSLIPATFVVAGANQISSSDVVDPATATASGKAADALATKNALGNKQAKITASGILQGDGSGGVTAATVDTTPTANSAHLVTSGGVKTAIDGIKPTRIYNEVGTNALDDKGQLFRSNIVSDSGNYFHRNGYGYSRYLGTAAGTYDGAYQTIYCYGGDNLAYIPSSGNVYVYYGTYGESSFVIYQRSNYLRCTCTPNLNPIQPNVDLAPQQVQGQLTWTFTPRTIVSTMLTTPYARFALESMPTAWAANTTYNVGVCASSGGKAYRCKTAHTSGSTFDATKWDEIPVLAQKADAADLAPAFSTSSTYAVGEHVTYNGKLYKCTTAVTTAGAWDASKWTAVAITDEMGADAPLPFDAEVEYLTVPVGAFIPTGIIGKGFFLTWEFNVRLPSDIQSSSGNFRIGTWGGSTGESMLVLKEAGNLRFGIGSNYDIESWEAVQGAFGTIGYDGKNCYCGSNSTATSGNTNIFATDKEFTIFGLNGAASTAQTVSADIKGAKITISGALARDYIPVRVGTTGYLYDKVTGKLFGSGDPSIPLVPASDVTPTITAPARYVEIKPSLVPYDIGTPTVTDTASSEVVEGETVYYGAATLADRTANIVQVTAATALDELRITFPAATSGKVRDFGLRVEIGTGSAALAAPALVPIAPTGETIKIENADGAIPALADGTATAKGVTLLYFSETAPGVFVVKGEQVEEVA